MKNKLISLGIVLMTLSAHGLELGKLSLSGSGCSKELIENLKPIEGDQNRYSLPLHLSLTKTEATTIKRNSCQFSLPIKVGEKEGVEVSAVSQGIKLKGNVKTPVKVQLSVSATGLSSSKKRLSAETKDDAEISEEIKNDGVIFNSKCGKDVIVRGNLSAFAQGPDAATASSTDLLLSIKVSACP